MPGKLIGWALGIFMALAGPLAFAAGGYWWALDRPAWHVGWCPFCVGWGPGAGLALAQLRSAEAAAALHAKQVQTAQTSISARASQIEADSQTKIVTAYRTIRQEIPVALPPAADPLLPRYWVRIHDEAVAAHVSAVSNTPSQSDDAPSDISASVALGTVVDNYGRCEAASTELSALQAWVTAEQGASR